MVTNSVMMQVFRSFAKTQGEHVETLSRDSNFKINRKKCLLERKLPLEPLQLITWFFNPVLQNGN
jgi:hypothetical protein